LAASPLVVLLLLKTLESSKLCNAGDKVVLSDLANWTASATSVVANGQTYAVYDHISRAQQLLIDNRVAVTAVL
jgi:hypothetical protein